MTKKVIYKHKTTGDLFAIETDDKGNVVSTSGPLLTKDIDPAHPDYDDYWNPDVSANLADFVPLSKLTIHVLRKYACQNWVDSGFPMHATAAFMGHSDIATTRAYYNHVDAVHVQKAATAIQSLLTIAEQKDGEKDVCETCEQAPVTEKG